MKKFFKFIWVTFIGLVIFRLVKKILTLTQYAKIKFFATLNYPSSQEQSLEDSYAMIFSAMELDLTELEPQEKVMNLQVLGRFASIVIKLPEDWNLQLQGKAKYSDISNCLEPAKDNSEKPLLIIQHDLKFSALVIETDAEQIADGTKIEPELPQ
jgi:hypothetical protein